MELKNYYVGRRFLSEGMDNKRFSRTWKDFKRCIKKDIYIYGAGKGCLEFLELYGTKYNISAIIDSNPDKWGTTINEIPVISIHNADRKLPCIISIIKNYESVMEMLHKEGFTYIFSYYELECRSDRCRRYVQYMKRISSPGMISQFRYLCRNNGINHKKIVFFMYTGFYSDHGKYISDYLHNTDSDYELVWFVRANIETPEYVKRVDISDSDACLYELATAGVVVINNADLPDWFKKRKGQLWLQTKHWTGITLKKFYLDADKISQNDEARKNWIRVGRMTDYVITGSKFDSDSCERGFRPSKGCVELGTARTDGLFCGVEESKTRIRKLYGIDSDTEILLYAPTYRYRWEGSNFISITPDYGLDYNRLLKNLRKRFDRDWVILVRLHPGMENDAAKMQWDDKIINATEYPDGQDLIKACDMLVSDYSSIMFEPAYINKPVILFADDIEKYLAMDYELLLDIHKLPFPLAENNDEMENIILNFDRDEYDHKWKSFVNQYDIKEDGHSCERIAEFIKNKLAE